MNPVFFYVPNVIGYIRIILLLISISYFSSNPTISLISYFTSSFLDALDGYAARVLNQSSIFGSGLDMIIDRCTTSSLIIYLSKEYDIRIMSGLVILDFSSHYLHMLVTSRKLQSHKQVSPSTPFLMRIYYQRREVLFFVCGGNEVFFMGLYAKMMGFEADWVVWATFPIFAFKQVMSVVQLVQACVDLAAIDDPRNKKD